MSSTRRAAIGSTLSPAGSIRLQPNTVYFMGESSCPEMVFVTAVTDETVEYFEVHTMGQPRRISQRWIAEHLMRQGCSRWVAMYGSLGAESIRAQVNKLKRLMGGLPVPEENPIAWEQVVALARSKDETDRWQQAEAYGNVVGLEVDGVMHYEISGLRSDVVDVLADERFEVVSLEKRA